MTTHKVTFHVELPDGKDWAYSSDSQCRLTEWRGTFLRIPKDAEIVEIKEKPKFVPGYYRFRADGPHGEIRWYDRVPMTEEDSIKYRYDDAPYLPEHVNKYFERIVTAPLAA